MSESMRTQNLLRSLLVYLVLAGLALLFVTPFAVAVLTSVKSPAELARILALPSVLYLENYEVAINQVGRGFVNSLLITIPSVVFSLFIGALAAYPLAQVRFRGDAMIYLFLLTGMFVPFQIVLIPLFGMMLRIGLFDSIPGMWLVHTAYGIPICTFFLRNYFTTIPRALFEAALADGCSIAGYFFRILLPLSKGGLAALAILQARSIWNELLFALTLTTSRSTRPITVELMTFMGAYDIAYGPLMAATLISIIPVMLTFFVFQREFVSGILGGGVKG